jgi:hypothetical protein
MYTFSTGNFVVFRGDMSKEVLSLRLDPDVIKWINSKATKGKNKSVIAQEILTEAMRQDKIGPKTEDVSLQAKSAKASILTVIMLETFLKQTQEKGDEIYKKACEIYQKKMQTEED